MDQADGGADANELQEEAKRLKARTQRFEANFRLNHHRPPRAVELKPVLSDMKRLVVVRKQLKLLGIVDVDSPLAKGPDSQGAEREQEEASEASAILESTGAVLERANPAEDEAQRPRPETLTVDTTEGQDGSRHASMSASYIKYMKHPEVVQTIASVQLQAAWRGRQVREASKGRLSSATSGEGQAPLLPSPDRVREVRDKRTRVFREVARPMKLKIDRSDCLAASFLSEQRMFRLVNLVQTPGWAAVNVVMTFMYSAHLALLITTGNDYPIFMLLTFVVASVCIVAQLLTMNLQLFLLTHRAFDAWLNYFNCLRWSVSFAMIFDHFGFKVFLIPSLFGAMILWNSADAMQMPRWLREFIGYWLITYWLVLVGMCMQLYMYQDVSVNVPFVAYEVSLPDHHNSALLVLVAFVAKDAFLEIMFPGCCKTVKRKVMKVYNQTRLKGLAKVGRLSLQASPKPDRGKGKGFDAAPPYSGFRMASGARGVTASAPPRHKVEPAGDAVTSPPAVAMSLQAV